ncbi:Nephrocystin-3, partial [Durusdinium trenchii]
ARDSASERFDWSSDEIESIDDPQDLRDRGVSVELLKDLLEEHELGGKTTREVVTEFVLPQTTDYGCSLAGLMKRSFPRLVGRASHYVVHAWDGSFERLVRTLEAVASDYRGPVDAEEGLVGSDDDDDDEGQEGEGVARDLLDDDDTTGPCHTAMFWIDLCAIDQHLHMEGYTDEERLWLHRDELLQNVRKCIERIPSTIIMMDPPHAPNVIGRAWCLYECMQALYYSRQELLMLSCPDDDQEAQGMLSAIDNFGEAVKAFTPDFEASKTSSEQDKEWLLTAVNAAHPSGSEWLNEQVGKVMLHWLAQEVLTDMFHNDRLAPIESLHELGTLLESLACVEQAHIQFVRSLDIARDQLGVEHARTLAIAHDLACLQAKHFYQFAQAEELLRETLTSRERILGPYHPATNETTIALARLLQAQGYLDKAEELYRSALQHSLVENGFAHRSSLIAANLLALLLQSKGNLFEGYILLARTLAVGLKVLGPRHLDVLVWRNNMAVLLQDFEHLIPAESVFRKALNDSEQAFGPDHPQTLNIVYNLGQCLWQQDKMRAAEMLFRRELSGCQTMLGMGHRDTVRSIRNMIEFLASQDRHDEADSYITLLEGMGQ